MRLIQMLLDAGADINAPPRAENGWTVLQGAAMRGHINLVHFLLQRGAQVNAAGAEENGRTALEGAAENGHLDTVQLLLNAGAEGLGNAAQLAERQRHYVIARLLRMENEKRGDLGT
jgi:ankyrin repeat protein